MARETESCANTSLAETQGSEAGSGGAPTAGRAGTAAAPRWAVVGIFLLLLVGALAYAQEFLTPVILGFLLTLVFSPVRRLLARRGCPDAIAAVAIVATLTTLLLALGLALTAPVMEWIEDSSTIGAQLEQRVREIRGAVAGETDGESISEVVERVADAAAPAESDVEEVVVREQSWLGTLITKAPAVVIQIVMVIVLLLFLLASGDMFYEKLVHVLPRLQDKKRAIMIVRDIERKLSRYLLTITIINSSLGLTIGVAMYALGMPDPLLFGVIGFLFNYVPYVGAIGGSAIAVIVGLLTFDGMFQALLPGAVYYLLTAIEGQFVTPYFVGRNLKLNTVVVFISVTFWAWLWSVVGMLIAVPLLVAARTVCEHIPSLDSYGDFLSARGAEREDQKQEGEPDGS